MKAITYREAINEALDEELARDPKVFIMGEDIGKHWGGSVGEFRGLYDKYGPDRIRETPISESAIVGAAIGAALLGMRPIANIMFADFLGVPMDEILNQLTKMRYMFGGKITLPVTILCLSGAGLSAAAHHAKNLEGLLMAIPQLKIISPATPYDAKGLLKSAIRDNNPKIYFMRTALMLGELGALKSEVPEEEYLIPLGKADIKRSGSDATVIAIGLMVHRALHAASRLQDEKSISIEVIDPRTLEPLDKKTIIESIKKTGKLIIMDEEPKKGSVASEIAATIAEEAFDFLDAPIKRVCAPNTPIPFSPVLEKSWMPSEEDLIKAVVEIAK